MSNRLGLIFISPKGFRFKKHYVNAGFLLKTP